MDERAVGRDSGQKAPRPHSDQDSSVSSQGLKRRIVVTGAAGEIGTLLGTYFSSSPHYDPVLTDLVNHDEASIYPANLSHYDPEWVERFAGADTIIHLANDSRPCAPWESVAENNIEVTFNVFRAAVQQKVRRIIFASSLKTMDGYRFSRGPIAADAPPRPTTFYAAEKLFAERLGRYYSEEFGLSVICLRLGYVHPEQFHSGRNQNAWRHSKWLSVEDLYQAVEKAIQVEDVAFAVLPLVSDNATMRWDLFETCRVLGYEPTKYTEPPSPPLRYRIRAMLGMIYKRFVDPAWQYYWD
jgi:nucleoside-diphosphate-sugar epimerase